jgi:CDP-glucose 4,6-dehydratase
MSAFWQDRPVFVTGATGLVGSWLVPRLLDAGADVVCLVRDWIPESLVVSSGALGRCRVVRGDLCDQALLERVLGEHEITTVMHLAAQAIVPIAQRNPVSTFESNIKGTWALLEACRRSPRVGQIVVASSDKAYGNHDGEVYDESFALRADHPYDVSKACADMIAQSYARTFDSPVAITRCGNFYGGGDFNWNRLVPGTVRSILRGQRPLIRSDGKAIRDWFYVEDGAAAYMHLAEKLAAAPMLRGEAFNFSVETRVSARELVTRIASAMGVKVDPEITGEAKGEIPVQLLSAEKARSVLGWTPRHTLDDGLRRTVAWYARFFQQREKAA